MGEVNDILELDPLSQDCLNARRHIRAAFTDARLRVQHWDPAPLIEPGVFEQPIRQL